MAFFLPMKVYIVKLKHFSFFKRVCHFSITNTWQLWPRPNKSVGCLAVYSTTSLQSWALSGFLNIFNNKKWFFSVFIKLIWLGVGFLNRTGVEIGYYLHKKCNSHFLLAKKFEKSESAQLERSEPLPSYRGPLVARLRSSRPRRPRLPPPPPRRGGADAARPEEGGRRRPPEVPPHRLDHPAGRGG